MKGFRAWPLVWVGALAVCVVALAAVASLWLLRGVHQRYARGMAAWSTAERGANLSRKLAMRHIQYAGEGDNGSDVEAWIDAWTATEPGLRFASIRQDGAPVFQQVIPSAGEAEPPLPGDVVVGRRVVRSGDRDTPLVTFEVTWTGTHDEAMSVEIGLDRDSVLLEERPALAALRSMFLLSIVAVAVSYGLCLLLVVWVLRREMKRENQRRQEEHLAFSGVLANGIVHDFRNPMSALRLDAQMLQREAESAGRPARMTELAGRIRKTLDRMEASFREFLYLAKPDEEEPQVVALAACARECGEMMQARFEARSIALCIETPDGDASVRAYPSALRRAILNLLANAEHFSPDGSDIRVRIARQGRQALLEVIDRGPGVPPEARARLFDMFFTTRPQGTGLGLFLARAAVERSGGQIAYADAPGGGACFRIALPVHEDGVRR